MKKDEEEYIEYASSCQIIPGHTFRIENAPSYEPNNHPCLINLSDLVVSPMLSAEVQHQHILVFSIVTAT